MNRDYDQQLNYLATEYATVDEHLIKELLDFVDVENLATTLDNYFPDHQFNPDMEYNDKQLGKHYRTVKRQLDVMRVERFLKKKYNR